MSYSDCKNGGGGIYSSDPSTVPKYFIGSLIDAGLKVTLYTGLLDTVVPYTLTEAAISYMTWGGTKGFTGSSFTNATMTPIMTGTPSTQTGRYHAERGLTYVIVNNAGHMVPRDVSVFLLPCPPLRCWFMRMYTNSMFFLVVNFLQKDPVTAYWMMQNIIIPV